MHKPKLVELLEYHVVLSEDIDGDIYCILKISFSNVSLGGRGGWWKPTAAENNSTFRYPAEWQTIYEILTTL